MSLTINSRKSMLGNKVILERDHLKEIEQYIKRLEATNRELSQNNNGLVKEVGRLRERSGKLYSQLSDLNFENSQLEQDLSEAIDNVPRFDEYIKLLGFQKIINRRSTEAKMYHFNKAEAQDVFKLGSNVVSNFMKKEEANIPFLNDNTKTATLLFDNQTSSSLMKEERREQFIAKVDMIGFQGEVVESLYFSDKDSLNKEIMENIEVGRPYKVTKYPENENLQLSSSENDYPLRVKVTDGANNSIEIYKINDFINKYEENITLTKVEQSLDSMKLLEEVVDNRYSIISAKEDLERLAYRKSDVLNGIHETYHDEIRGGLLEDTSSLEKEENAKLDVEVANAEKYLNKYLDKENDLKDYVETSGGNYNDYLEDNRVDEIVDALKNTHHDFEDAHKYVFEEKTIEQNTSQALSL